MLVPFFVLHLNSIDQDFAAVCSDPGVEARVAFARKARYLRPLEALSVSDSHPLHQLQERNFSQNLTHYLKNPVIIASVKPCFHIKTSCDLPQAFTFNFSLT